MSCIPSFVLEALSPSPRPQSFRDCLLTFEGGKQIQLSIIIITFCKRRQDDPPEPRLHATDQGWEDAKPAGAVSSEQPWAPAEGGAHPRPWEVGVEGWAETDRCRAVKLRALLRGQRVPCRRCKEVPASVFLWEGRWQLGAAGKVGRPPFLSIPLRCLSVYREQVLLLLSQFLRHRKHFLMTECKPMQLTVS